MMMSSRFLASISIDKSEAKKVIKSMSGNLEIVEDGLFGLNGTTKYFSVKKSTVTISKN